MQRSGRSQRPVWRIVFQAEIFSQLTKISAPSPVNLRGSNFTRAMERIARVVLHFAFSIRRTAVRITYAYEVLACIMAIGRLTVRGSLSGSTHCELLWGSND